MRSRQSRFASSAWRHTFLAAGVCALLLAGGAGASGQTVTPRPAVANPGQAEDEKAIRAAAAAMTKAFNAADAKALAGLFAPAADYVDEEGQVFHGRAAIEREFAAGFAKQKGMTAELTIESLRFLGKDVALENGVCRIKPAAGGRGKASRYAAVRARGDGKWLLESVRESPYTSACNYEYLSELEWLVGDWTGKTADATVDMKCEWMANRNYLVRSFTVKNGAGTLSSGKQIIGWDPTAGRVRSWSFDSDGGFGSEFWAKDGKRWVLEARGVHRDGGQSVATNVVTPVDHDTFTWQSVGRRLDDVRLPDTAAVKVVRTKDKK